MAHGIVKSTQTIVVMDDGDSSEIIDSYDKVMTKVNVCINANQQHIDTFGKLNIYHYGTHQ